MIVIFYFTYCISRNQSKVNDKFYATGAFCTHYGAPLEKGILCGERIVCPWHNACFNAIAGDQEEPPGLDSLSTFPTKVVGDNVLVTVPEAIHQQHTLAMAKCRPNNVPFQLFQLLSNTIIKKIFLSHD